MKNILGLVVFGSALALAGCGGDSDSSGSYNSYSAKVTIGNGNTYTCTSKTAKEACSSDATCMATDCELTTEAVTPVPETGAECEVDGNTVYGKLGKTCTVTLDKLNGGEETELACSSSGALILGNGAQFTNGSVNLNGYTLTCS